MYGLICSIICYTFLPTVEAVKKGWIESAQHVHLILKGLRTVGVITMSVLRLSLPIQIKRFIKILELSGIALSDDI